MPPRLRTPWPATPPLCPRLTLPPTQARASPQLGDGSPTEILRELLLLQIPPSTGPTWRPSILAAVVVRAGWKRGRAAPRPCCSSACWSSGPASPAMPRRSTSSTSTCPPEADGPGDLSDPSRRRAPLHQARWVHVPRGKHGGRPHHHKDWAVPGTFSSPESRQSPRGPHHLSPIGCQGPSCLVSRT